MVLKPRRSGCYIDRDEPTRARLVQIRHRQATRFSLGVAGRMCSPSVGATKPVSSLRCFLAIRNSPCCWPVARWLTGKGAACGRAPWGGAVPPGYVPAGIREEFIHFRQPVDDCLHIFLPAKPFADSVLQDLDLDPARVTLRYEAIAYDPFIEQIALAICQQLSAETSAGRLLVELLGQALSAYLIDRYPEAPLNAKPPGTSGKPIDDRRMARVMEFIDASIERNFTVADLAVVACMSPAHFARSFKATIGRTPHQFVSQMRLELAKRMLADRHRSISDIALSTGFSSQSNFSRAFRDATGMTPGAYRASQIGSQAAHT